MQKPPPAGIGVFSEGTKVFLYTANRTAKNAALELQESTDGVHFATKKTDVRIIDGHHAAIDVSSVVRMNVAKMKKGYSAVIEQKTRTGMRHAFAVGPNHTHFRIVGTAPYIPDFCAIASGVRIKDHAVAYFGGRHVGVMESKDCADWMVIDSDILTEENFFVWYTIGSAQEDGDHILVLYLALLENGKKTLNWATFSAKDPSGMLETSDTPLWESPAAWDASFCGAVMFAKHIISYWTDAKNGIVAVTHGPIAAKHFGILKRVVHNPILSPISKHFWESKAVFNPAAIYSKGKVHLIYRAIGDSDVSVLGYAASADGVHIEERLAAPIFAPVSVSTAIDNPQNPPLTCSPDPDYAPPNGLYVSGGGGWGGSEDPRITEIDGKMYLTYVAYDGWSAPQVAITSLGSNDFHMHAWNWTPPKVISPPGMVDKNAVLFPEKIHGKYVMLHRVFPNMYIDFLDDLSFEDQKYLTLSRAIAPRSVGWDSRKVGAGAPPIKTDDGWLLIYHAVGERDSGRYKIGAMVLDQNDPTNVLYRSREPILAPDIWYENEGFKSGVVYPCGAVAINNRLMVYYGGADRVTCAAEAYLPEFLRNLKSRGRAVVHTISIS